ncbi:MAG: hypothetical protein EOO41_03920, partial [Methanobacteriota archaeon]
MVGLQIIDGFGVVCVPNVDASVRWLNKMHQAVISAFNQSAECSLSAPAAIIQNRGTAHRTASLGAGDCERLGAAEVTSPTWQSHDILSLAAQGAACLPSLRRRGHGARVGFGAALQDDDAMLSSQSAHQIAAIQREQVVWPVGGGYLRWGASPTPTATSTHLGSAPARTPSASVPPACAASRSCTSDVCQLWGRAAFPRRIITYEEWQALASKPRMLSLMTVFGRMLRQVHGCSADKAQAILERYKTPRGMMAAYAAAVEAGGSRAGEFMMRDFLVPRQRNTLGPSLSATLFRVFNTRVTQAGSSSSGGSGAACASVSSLADEVSDAELAAVLANTQRHDLMGISPLPLAVGTSGGSDSENDTDALHVLPPRAGR